MRRELGPKKYMLIFFILTMGFQLGVEVFMRTIGVQRDNLVELVVDIFNANEHNIILGDSHTVNLFPGENGDFRNYSLGGLNVPQLKEIYEVIGERTKIEKVILVASPQIFSEERINKVQEKFDSLKKANWIEQRMISFFPLVRKQLVPIIKGWNHPLNDEGKAWLKVEPNEKEKLLNERITIQKPVAFLRDHPHFKLYVEMIKKMKQNGVEVCLVRTPVVKAYLEKAQKSETYNEAIELFKHIGQDENIKFLDFLDLEKSGMDFSDNVFKNQDHIMKVVGKEYSKLLIQYCFN